MNTTHCAFSDESHWNQGRYRSVGLVTVMRERAPVVRTALCNLLKESGMSELGWEGVRTAKDRFAALKICRIAVELACKGDIRIDVVQWDIHDRRHKVRGRDDNANFRRMYYYLLRNVLCERWPAGSVWGLYPHQHSAGDWEGLRNNLDKVDTFFEVDRNLFSSGKLRIHLKRLYKVQEIEPVTSVAEPAVQVADLFAGMTVFSREFYRRFCLWKEHNDPQPALFERDVYTAGSASESERFRVLHEFDGLCKKARMGVSLRTYQGLRTLDPNRPINFWWYEPQHKMDKAPTKVSQLKGVAS